MREENNQAIYKQIKEAIVDDILSINYGEKAIKSQEEYARLFEVSRTTVRRAINELVDQGILYAVKGKGTFVKPLRGKRTGIKTTLNFSSSERAKLYRLSSRVLRIETIEADYVIASALKIEIKSPVVVIERIRYMDDLPESVQRAYLNYEDVSHISFEDEKLEVNSLYAVLERKAELEPRCSDQEIRAIHCPERIADYLEIEMDAPVLYIKRVTLTPEGKVMEYMEDYSRTDAQALRVRVMG